MNAYEVLLAGVFGMFCLAFGFAVCAGVLALTVVIRLGHKVPARQENTDA